MFKFNELKATLIGCLCNFNIVVMYKLSISGSIALKVFGSRAGSDEKFLESLVKLKSNKVVYISCNPITQGRNLKYLTKHGCKVEKIQPVDMFPHTGHVECVTRYICFYKLKPVGLSYTE